MLAELPDIANNRNKKDTCYTKFARQSPGLDWLDNQQIA